MTPEGYPDDQDYFIQTLFSKKRDKKEIIERLAELEKTPDTMTLLFKKYHPYYYLPFGNTVAKFLLAKDLKLT